MNIFNNEDNYDLFIVRKFVNTIMHERSTINRPWTFVPRVKRSPRKLRIPEVNTYCQQIQQCKDLYAKLHLENGKHDRKLPSINRSYTTLSFSSPILSRSAPATAYYKKQNSSPRNFGTGSPIDPLPKAPLQGQERSWPFLRTEHSRDGPTPSTVADSENFESHKNRPTNPLQLSEHLRMQGYGMPIMITSSATADNSQYNLPPGVKSRVLTKNPSKREKIKGRARLDYEMANLRALAFCEQQTPKVFRTASAHMRNRDVQFVEDEFRENLQQGEMDDKASGSVVAMAIDREELFERVHTWIDGVECAWKVT